ncbi:MAG: ral L-amino acid transport system substrate-binding protein [Bradyrhizobium sp.]
MYRGIITATVLAASIAGASAATLDTVKQRGTLVCGVSTGFAGFSAPDSQGNFKGLDVDYCRALAAGVLGDASKVRYVALTAQNRFTALQSGEIDVLYRNSTQTYLRGTTLGLRQGPVNFYDGQGFVVKKDLGVKELKDLKGATVCVAQGTTHEVTLGDYGRANGIDWKPLVFDRVDTMYQTFFGGRCDAMTQDASALAGAVATAAPKAEDYVVLPQTISKEPLGPFTRNGDEVWSDIITWLHYGLVEAEELGVTQTNADEMAKSQVPAIQRLLGASGDLGSRLGLDNKWLVAAIKPGGNYGEIFERNVGKSSPLKLERGLNATWSKGGLMYAIPFKLDVTSPRSRGLSERIADAFRVRGSFRELLPHLLCGYSPSPLPSLREERGQGEEVPTMRITLIHALKHSIVPIESSFAKLWPEARLMNLLDDSLSADLARDGKLTERMTERFLTMGRYAADTGADGILFTCSAFGPCIEAVARAHAPMPVLKPNEAMIEQAAAQGKTIGLLSTFPPTLVSMPPEFPSSVTLVPKLVEGALAALDRGDRAEHDRLVVEASKDLRDCDLIALAQYSMAPAADRVTEATGRPVLTTPDSAVAKLKAMLGAH